MDPLLQAQRSYSLDGNLEAGRRFSCSSQNETIQIARTPRLSVHSLHMEGAASPCLEDDHDKGKTLPPRNPLSSPARIGSLGLAITVLATALLMASITFLSFLWWSSNTGLVWRLIMLNDWATRSVTLTSLVIRLAVSTQATLAVSMLAALVLERTRRGVLLRNFVALSIMRYVNTGPLTSMPYLFEGNDSFGGLPLLALALVLTLTTTLSHFTSTILLSDINRGQVIGFTSEQTMPIGFDWSTQEQTLGPTQAYNPNGASNYWSTTPLLFPPFAEYAGPTNSQKHIADTGSVLRALLPLPSDTSRLSVHNYTGTAMTWDARVACFAPIFSNLSLQNTINYQQTISGSVLPSASIPELLYDTTNDAPFNCTILPPPDYENHPGENAIMMCSMTYEGGLISALNPYDNSSLHHDGISVLYNDTFAITSVPGNSWLIFNYSGSSWGSYNPSYVPGPPLKMEWSATKGDVWSDINVTLYSDDDTLMGESLISSTICYDAL
jgi:hypothetical protein